jgi:hypothetical protein
MSRNPRRDDDGVIRRRTRVTTLAVVTTCIAALCPTTLATGTMKNELHSNLNRNLLTTTPTTRTWNDLVDETIATCATPPATSTTEECVLGKLRSEVRNRAKDSPNALCAARETTRRAMRAVNEGSSGPTETLVVRCDGVGLALGEIAFDANAEDAGLGSCGEAADAACDGSCAQGVLKKKLNTTDAHDEAMTIGVETCGKVDAQMKDLCARALGWVMRGRRSTAAEARADCASAGSLGDANVVEACRFGVVQAHAKDALERGVDVNAICGGADVVGEPKSQRAADACANALGAALCVAHEYDDVRAREQCDLISDARIKERCVAGVDEERTRREIDLVAAVPSCARALRTLLGDESAAPDVFPPPPPPVDRSAVDHRKEALRRHGSGVGGALWFSCFTVLVVTIACVTAYLRWRDGAGPIRPAGVQYSRVAATEMGTL